MKNTFSLIFFLCNMVALFGVDDGNYQVTHEHYCTTPITYRLIISDGQKNELGFLDYHMMCGFTIIGSLALQKKNKAFKQKLLAMLEHEITKRNLKLMPLDDYCSSTRQQ